VDLVFKVKPQLERVAALALRSFIQLLVTRSPVGAWVAAPTSLNEIDLGAKPLSTGGLPGRRVEQVSDAAIEWPLPSQDELTLGNQLEQQGSE
jgi:hypothetical protein